MTEGYRRRTCQRVDDHKGRSPQRDRLFSATLAVALEHGFGRVTLDAVAERAGMSKGGLLYHFPSKTHLIQALLSRYAQSSGGRQGREARPGPADAGVNDPFAVAMLIAGAENPDLLEQVADFLLPGEKPADTDPDQRRKLLMAGLISRLSML